MKIKKKNGPKYSTKPLQLSHKLITTRKETLLHDILWSIFIDTEYIIAHFTSYVYKTVKSLIKICAREPDYK